MKVHFQNVGSKHASWTSEIEALTYSALLEAVRPYLYSRSSFNEVGTGGVIVVGCVRIVGHFRLEGGCFMGEISHD